MTNNGQIDDEDEDTGTEVPSGLSADVAPHVRAARAEDAALVERARSGDSQAFGQLYDRWFDRTQALVRSVVHDLDTGEEVCQEAFLVAWQTLDRLLDPLAFGGWLLRIARNLALKRVDREMRSRPIDDAGFVVMEHSGGSAGVSAPAGFDLEGAVGRATDPATAVASNEVAALVQEAVAALGPRDAEVLNLQLRSELTPAEIGEVVGLNRNAANQLCHRVRGRFATAFRARMLWHGGRAVCDLLSTELSTAGITSFGAEAVTVAERHAGTCDACGERRRTLVQTSAFLAAIPLLPAPVLMKARIAGRLAAQGVPMEGSVASTGATTSAAGSGSGDGSGQGSGQASGQGPSDGSGQGSDGPASGSSSPGPVPASAGLAARSTGSSARRVALAGGVAVVVAVVVLLVIAVAVLSRRGGEDDDLLVASDVATTSTSTSLAGPSDSSTPSSVADSVADGDQPAPGESTDPDSPPEATTTTSPTTTTTTAPPATIELLDLTPSATKATPYTLGPDSPVLRWRVRDATEIAVWLLSDTGSGLSRTQVLATSGSGELQVCPGTVDGTTCNAMVGTYAFEIEATGKDGTTVLTDPADRPTFDVVPTIY